MKFENLRLDRICAVLHYTPEQTAWRATARNSHIIGVNMSGTSCHDLGYKNITISPNCIYFFNQKDDYSVLVKETGLCHSVHFTATEPIETESFCKKIGNAQEIANLVFQVERDRQSAGNELKLLSDFYALCHSLHTLYSRPYAPRDARVLLAKEQMDLHFKEKGCLELAVAQSGLTQRRFCDLFYSYAGMTPNRYIISKRLALAKELLSLDYLSCREVAELCGFSDAYYFSKLFKKEVGLSPTQYKRTV